MMIQLPEDTVTRICIEDLERLAVKARLAPSISRARKVEISKAIRSRRIMPVDQVSAVRVSSLFKLMTEHILKRDEFEADRMDAEAKAEQGEIDRINGQILEMTL